MRLIGCSFCKGLVKCAVRNRRREPISILHRRLEKPLLALEAALDGSKFIKAVFHLTKSAVACDFVNVCLRIVRKGEVNIAYAMIDSRRREFGRELLEDSFFINHPGMPILMAHPGIRFINTREVLPPDEVLQTTRFYREVMQVMDFRHAIAMFLWSDPPQTPEAIFSLYRIKGNPDFTDEEVALLDRLYPHIQTAFDRVNRIEKERAVRDEMRSFVRRTGRATCVLDWELAVAGASRAARENCARWNSGRDNSRLKAPPFRLPDPLREACADLKAHWSSSQREEPVAGSVLRRHVQHPFRPTLQATVSMHLSHLDPFAKPGFVIDFSAGVSSSPVFSGSGQDPHLTPAESGLVELVRRGLSNQEIAQHTGKALGTVKNLLHAIFKKAGVTSRSALTAQTQRPRRKTASVH